ncbi:MAG TPA: response regulator [Anaerolineae bacterium]|nr:response regulator [Anaerolineae bacterium]
MGTKKILVVDDDPLTCELISKILEINGFETAIVTEHKKVLETTKNEQPDLILMDYHLGTTHGLEILQLVKAKPWGQDIPIIIASGIDRKSVVLDAGADAFLLKPFDWAELVAAVNDLLQE